MSGLLVLVALVAAEDKTAGPDKRGKDDRPAPRVEERRADAVLTWNEVALDLIRRDRTPPPAASRHLAILHAAIADAVNAIYQTHKPYRVTLRATEPIDPAATVAACAHRVLTELHPRQTAHLDAQRGRALAAIPDSGAKTRGVQLGRHVAERILAWRRDDGSGRVVGYHAAAANGIWRPTPPAFAAALLPQWSELVPFGVRDRRTFRPPAPPEVTGKEYASEFDEVKRIGGRNSRARTAEQSIIAWFWDDGPGTCTPPGHWNQIAREASLHKKLLLPENARLFALLNIALADAAVVCWDCKYHFKLWRPVTAIREADRDGNPDTAGEAGWQPLLNTPPFPSYTSGHSTFSGAAATILEKFFGSDDMDFSVGSDGFPGQRRVFKGFAQAAREAGMSRIYGGIHYECDNREGLAMGKAVALEVFRTRLVPTEQGTPDQAPRRRPLR
jgi:hypothetical protein